MLDIVHFSLLLIPQAIHPESHPHRCGTVFLVYYLAGDSGQTQHVFLALYSPWPLF